LAPLDTHTKATVIQSTNYPNTNYKK